MDSQVIADESYILPEEEVIQAEENYQDVQAIIEINPAEIDINGSFFMGVQIAGVMCLFSLGIAVVLKMFRQSV